MCVRSECVCVIENVCIFVMREKEKKQREGGIVNSYINNFIEQVG